jgi:hypothetical protein
MAGHEAGRGEVCSELPYMPMQQTKQPKNTQMAQTAVSTATTMERYEYGLRGGSTGK